MTNKLKIKLIRIFVIALITALTTSLAAPNFLTRDSSTVQAVGDLNVIWGVPDGDPIFVVNNMAPGDVEERDVDVQNNAPSARPVGVRGVPTSDPDNLSTVLDIEIFEGLTLLYGPKTLDEFFTESAGPDGIFLSNLGIGASTTYTFKVTFQDSAGNEFQDTEVIFDLIIGLSIDLPAECDQIDLLPTPIIGTSKAENLTGTPGNDLIMGLEGADKIEGNGGDDCILGGTGADRLNGNAGNDAIFGEDHADSIFGNNGNDFLVGGSGADSIRGENGEDHLIGNEHADTLDGGNENDLLEGGIAADTLNGGGGNDELHGNDGVDTLNGGPGNDDLFGENQNDTLRGDAGADFLDGGANIDTANGGANTDTCTNNETQSSCEL